MNNFREYDVIESKHYEEIVNYFENEEDETSREIFRDKYLASLMDELKQDPSNLEMVINSIIIMNILIDENNPSNKFNRIGQSKEELSEKEAEVLKKKLKKLSFI